MEAAASGGDDKPPSRSGHQDNKSQTPKSSSSERKQRRKRNGKDDGGGAATEKERQPKGHHVTPEEEKERLEFLDSVFALANSAPKSPPQSPATVQPESQKGTPPSKQPQETQPPLQTSQEGSPPKDQQPAARSKFSKTPEPSKQGPDPSQGKPTSASTQSKSKQPEQAAPPPAAKERVQTRTNPAPSREEAVPEEAVISSSAAPTAPSEQATGTPENENPFPCIGCHRAFDSKKALDRHLAKWCCTEKLAEDNKKQPSPPVPTQPHSQPADHATSQHQHQHHGQPQQFDLNLTDNPHPQPPPANEHHPPKQTSTTNYNKGKERQPPFNTLPTYPAPTPTPAAGPSSSAKTYRLVIKPKVKTVRKAKVIKVPIRPLVVDHQFGGGGGTNDDNPPPLPDPRAPREFLCSLCGHPFPSWQACGGHIRWCSKKEHRTMYVPPATDDRNYELPQEVQAILRQLPTPPHVPVGRGQPQQQQQQKQKQNAPPHLPLGSGPSQQQHQHHQQKQNDHPPPPPWQQRMRGPPLQSGSTGRPFLTRYPTVPFDRSSLPQSPAEFARQLSEMFEENANRKRHWMPPQGQGYATRAPPGNGDGMYRSGPGSTSGVRRGAARETAGLQYHHRPNYNPGVQLFPTGYHGQPVPVPPHQQAPPGPPLLYPRPLLRIFGQTYMYDQNNWQLMQQRPQPYRQDYRPQHHNQQHQGIRNHRQTSRMQPAPPPSSSAHQSTTSTSQQEPLVDDVIRLSIAPPPPPPGPQQQKPSQGEKNRCHDEDASVELSLLHGETSRMKQPPPSSSAHASDSSNQQDAQEDRSPQRGQPPPAGLDKKPPDQGDDGSPDGDGGINLDLTLSLR